MLKAPEIGVPPDPPAAHNMQELTMPINPTKTTSTESVARSFQTWHSNGNGFYDVACCLAGWPRDHPGDIRDGRGLTRR